MTPTTETKVPQNAKSWYHGVGSASLDLAYVAAGRFDAFWERSLQSWDIAAGIVLVREAGGMITDLNGGADMLTKGEVLALDAKFNFDDSALFRHPEVAAMRDVAEEDPREVEASKSGLNYIGLDGNIA